MQERTGPVLDWRGVGVMFGGYLLAAAIVAVTAAVMLLGFKTDIQYSSGFVLVAYILSIALPILAFDFAIMRPRKQRLTFSFKQSPFHTYMLMIPMMLGAMFMAEYFVSLIPTDGPYFGPMYDNFVRQMSMMANDSWTLVILTVLFAPVLEEMLFRGIIQRGLVNRGLAPWKAVLLSSFVFGAVHGYPWQFVGGFILGLVLGIVYYKTKSLTHSILLHAFNNLIASLMMMFSDKESFAELFGVPSWIFLAVGTVLFGVFYYLFMYRDKVIYQE